MPSVTQPVGGKASIPTQAVGLISYAVGRCYTVFPSGAPCLFREEAAGESNRHLNTMERDLSPGWRGLTC